MNSQELLRKAKAARTSTLELRRLPEEARTKALLAIRRSILEAADAILAANAIDGDAARENQLSAALIDRMTLTQSRLENLARSLQEIAESPAVLGQITEEHRRADGLLISRKRIPLGVIAVIFESRPHVLIDCAALAIKSGNAILLKGGSDAVHSNTILAALLREAIAPFLPIDCVQIVPAGDRALTVELVQLNEWIDLVIPRGGEGLIRMIQQHARIPVIAHAKGLCHLYLHEDAAEDRSIAITLNAKVQRPGVCNAIETLLVHEALAQSYLLSLLHLLTEAGVQLRVDAGIWALNPDAGWQRADASDWDTEYLDKILSVRLVKDADEAIQHILLHGSHHTEGLVTNDQELIQKFEESIDASCLVINASTRFNDGGELGLGAEIGISTTRLHAYGPMGARELTTTRFVVQGDGHVRR